MWSLAPGYRPVPHRRWLHQGLWIVLCAGNFILVHANGPPRPRGGGIVQALVAEWLARNEIRAIRWRVSEIEYLVQEAVAYKLAFTAAPPHPQKRSLGSSVTTQCGRPPRYLRNEGSG